MCQSKAEGGRRCAAYLSDQHAKAKKANYEANQTFIKAQAEALESRDYTAFEQAKNQLAEAQSSLKSARRAWWITETGYKTLTKDVVKGKATEEDLTQVTEERRVIKRAETLSKKAAKAAQEALTAETGREPVRVTKRSNDYAGACASCGHIVPSGKGSLSKAGGRFHTYHKPGECPEGEPATFEFKVQRAEQVAVEAKVEHAEPTATPVRENRFAGQCAWCGKPVATGEGRIEKIGGKWRVFHLTKAECEASATAPSPQVKAVERVEPTKPVEPAPRVPQPNRKSGDCNDCLKTVGPGEGILTPGTYGGYTLTHPHGDCERVERFTQEVNPEWSHLPIVRKNRLWVLASENNHCDDDDEWHTTGTYVPASPAEISEYEAEQAHTAARARGEKALESAISKGEQVDAIPDSADKVAFVKQVGWWEPVSVYGDKDSLYVSYGRYDNDGFACPPRKFARDEKTLEDIRAFAERW